MEKRTNYRIQAFRSCITCGRVDAIQDSNNLYYAVCGLDGEEIDGAGICDHWIREARDEKND